MGTVATVGQELISAKGLIIHCQHTVDVQNINQKLYHMPDEGIQRRPENLQFFVVM